jgi:5-methylcytosine-specific restriction protein B
VNIDETTHMFSPKVLDRANVIEFRMKDTELASFLEKPVKPNLDQLDGKGEEFGQAFVDAAKNPADVPDSAKLHFQCEMLLFFKVLQNHGSEFGYRVAHEAGRFVHFYEKLGGETDVDKWFKDAFDCIIVQKFLPKLHGSETKLRGVLFSLAHLCVNKREWTGTTLKDNEERIDELAIEAKTKADSSENSPVKLEEKLKAEDKAPHYPLSFEKIERMWRAAHENGFASFAES